MSRPSLDAATVPPIMPTAKSLPIACLSLLALLWLCWGQAVNAPPELRPTHANLAYAKTPGEGSGHLLDLYLPATQASLSPVVIWTGGSAWLADSGKSRAGTAAAPLVSAGFAVAGASIRSSAQAKFPGQLHDIKAAIRWLRAYASDYRLDANRIAIMGDSSGGWTAAIAATSGDVPELEGSLGSSAMSSKVQAAVAFFPPTDFLANDAVREAAVMRSTTAAGCGQGPGTLYSQLVHRDRVPATEHAVSMLCVSSTATLSIETHCVVRARRPHLFRAASVDARTSTRELWSSSVPAHPRC